MSAAAVVAESAPPIGTHAMSTRPMSPSFSSVSSWPMSPRWIVWIPSSSLTNAVWRPRSAPLDAVAVCPHAREQRVVDLVLARAVQHECRLQAGGDRGAAVARQL